MTKYPYSEFVTEASNEQVLNETGRMWCQWFSELESKGYGQIGLIELREILQRDYQLELSIAESISRAFFSRYSKQKNSLSKGFDICVSKTFNHPVNQVFNCAAEWFESENRTELQKRISLKRLNCRWLSDNSKIDVKFHAKGNFKTQMIIQHDHMANESDAQIMKNYWKERLPKMIESF